MFEAISKAYESTGNVDMVTVESLLSQEPLSKRPQVSVSELMGAQSSVPSNITKHCEILIELALRRSAQTELLKLTKEMTNYDGYELLDRISELSSLSETQGVTAKSYSPAEILARDKTKTVFLPTGIMEFDKGICNYAGQRKGQVEVTIADSGHGKTHYAMLKASKLAKQGYKVHWFQLEDSDEKTAQYFADHCGTHSDNVIICDSIDDIEAIKREARLGKRTHETDHIVVDYVQNVVCSRKNRNDQVEYISGQLTKMAKSLNVSVHLLSQVTMEYGKRHGWNQEPRGGDVRWSQQLKQDAHLGTAIFRPSMIETLVEGDMVKDWNDKPIPLNSVFLRQWKVRGGEMSYSRVHLIHNDKGLQLMATWQQQNYEKNNAWRSNSPF
jgi:replicative DNA helicase